MQQSPWAFSSKPKALGVSNDEEMVCNIMSDPRVMRGSTSVRQKKSKDPVAVEKVARRRRRRPKQVVVPAGNEFYRREEKKEKVDLSHCLVEQAESIETRSADCQTGPFLELSDPLPFFSGRRADHHQSVSTTTEGLFCFDREADPIVRVLVAKTLQQALVEVEREEEYSILVADGIHKNKARQAELERIERLTDARLAELAQKKVDIDEANDARNKRQVLERKVACSQLMRAVVPAVLEECFAHFEKTGQWVEPLVEDIRRDFLPDLYSSVSDEYHHQSLGHDALDDLISQVVKS